jgi:hypothetical protein
LPNKFRQLKDSSKLNVSMPYSNGISTGMNVTKPPFNNPKYARRWPAF